MLLPRAFSRVALVIACVTASACSSDSVTAAPAVPLESETWASALGVTLSQFTKLSTGVFYLDTVDGTGAVLTGTPTVEIYYAGYLPSGVKFDERPRANNGLPICFRLDRLIDGWIVGLQGMKIEGKRRLLIPPSLGYGAVANGSIPANSNLLFDVELVGVGCTP
ncbi:MAG: FKBP-type peptidyl-prolyl cis-trans isomerase [Gemmatimonadota bacterium]